MCCAPSLPWCPQGGGTGGFGPGDGGPHGPPDPLPLPLLQLSHQPVSMSFLLSSSRLVSSDTSLDSLCSALFFLHWFGEQALLLQQHAKNRPISNDAMAITIMLLAPPISTLISPVSSFTDGWNEPVMGGGAPGVIAECPPGTPAVPAALLAVFIAIFLKAPQIPAEAIPLVAMSNRV